VEYDPARKSVKKYLHSETDRLSLINNSINAITEDKDGNIWVGTAGGLSMFHPGGKGFINYSHVNTKQTGSLSNNFVNALAIEGKALWIGTSGGLDILDTKTGEFSNIPLNLQEKGVRADASVESVFIDKLGLYWLGTSRHGLSCYDKNLNVFNHVQNFVTNGAELNRPMVSAFAEDQHGNIFVGTQGPGVTLFNRRLKTFQHFDIQSRSKKPRERFIVLSMLLNKKGDLIIGSFGDGLFFFDPISHKYQQLLSGEQVGDLNHNDIFCLKEDSKGNLWVGTNGAGINVLSPDKKVIKRYCPHPKLPNDILLPINGYIRDIKEDSEGNLWIGTHGGGIAKLNEATGQFTIYNTNNSELPNDKIYSLLEDRTNNIWIGTKGGGLTMLNKTTNKFSTFAEKNGLANTTIYKIIEDVNGLIWVSTNKGISSVDASNKKVRNYNFHNGVQHNNFINGSGLRTSDGELFFGGLEGFNYFNPSTLSRNNNIPIVLITDLRISNQSVEPSQDGPLKDHITEADEINLDYKQNFALSFVGLSYTSPEQTQYAYKLEGFDKDWNDAGNSTLATYTNLDPGSYTFRVKAANNDGVWNETGASIKINVHPPFYRSVYAMILYAVLIAALLLYIRYRGIRKLKRRFALDQEQMLREQEQKEAERIHELDSLKIKFLTNLSHEFRTPISLILGPADKLLRMGVNNKFASNLQLINRNARRLLNMVNQLLDFRRMEESELSLHPEEGELIIFIKEVTDSFKDLAERKNIDFNFSSAIEKLHTLFDHDKMERILFNVLSNAFKFTLKGGSIDLEVKGNTDAAAALTWVTITVSDTGIGIPADKQEKIFERFFQHTTASSVLNQGTGIGLSITREFVQMQGGTIHAESEPGKGTSFIIRLPFTPVVAAPAIAECLFIDHEQETAIGEENGNKCLSGASAEDDATIPSILLVEDDDDFRFYLKDNLRTHYKVYEAANGKEGWQKTLGIHPQLVVSDISMPYMDGIQLSQKIKKDKRTGHIPVILLTALTGEGNELKGLDAGASDYISKPFNFEVLHAKIRNLLLLNTTLKNTYTRQIKMRAPEIEIESEDEKFLQKIMLYLEENLTNSQLSVEELSRHVGMSRSSLYAKLLHLTGETPVEYIRSVKLDKAAVLLEKSEMNVAQIAYTVGFATPNYFSKSFKAKFDLLPSDYRKKWRTQQE
jgi:signal transduction histidine kinase/ligand-binding sensor domain-containing protein/DNA-binding response OmpR family regulator